MADIPQALISLGATLTLLITLPVVIVGVALCMGGRLTRRRRGC